MSKEKVNLDAPSDIKGLTFREKFDWEARYRQMCKRYHRQPCNCSPWEDQSKDGK